jgi:ribonuclease PH
VEAGVQLESEGGNHGKARKIGAITAGIAGKQAMVTDLVYLEDLNRQSWNQKVSRE